MTDIKDDFDSSVAGHSVFDWGESSKDGDSASAENQNSAASTGAGPSSRYDPKAMSRIVDITDLVDDSDDNDSDFEEDINPRRGGKGNSSQRNISAKNQAKVARKKRRNENNGGGGRYKCPMLAKQIVIMTSLVGIIVAASLAIGYAVINGRGDAVGGRLGGGGGGRAASTDRGEEKDAQKLLKIAERVTEACSESKLDADPSTCQRLCRPRLCCFDEGDEAEYSCKDDEEKQCAVYAGCQALVEGVPLGDEAEDEE